MTADIADAASTMLVDSLVIVSTSAAAAATTVTIPCKGGLGFASHAQDSGYGADDRGGDGHDVGHGLAGEILGGD
jgi:hypothetical protein